MEMANRTARGEAQAAAWPRHRFGVGAPFALPSWVRQATLLAILLSLAYRAAILVWHTDLDLLRRYCDGGINWNMAVNFAQGRGFYVTDPGPGCSFQAAVGPSHHFSPLMPLLEAAGSALFGPSRATADLVLFLISAGAVVVAFLCTADLFGYDAGLVAGALAGWEWTLRFYGTEVGYAESLVFLTLTLTLWAILRSLQQERYIIWAGLFAGLGYLSKASVGWFFLIAGVGGLGWRLWHRGLATFRSQSYRIAIALFAVLFGIWALRNLHLFWDHTATGLLTQWQTSAYNAGVARHAFQHPADLGTALLLKAPLLALAPLPLLVPLWPNFRQAFRLWRREDVSGIALAALLFFLLGWLFSSAFYLVEGGRWFWLHHIRYVSPVILPLAWLAMGYGQQPFSLWRWTLCGAWLLLYHPLLHHLVPFS
ncbi:MAG TPA: glycosyltransferase family 39 protein [Candidatus Thermoplasmatota archaeon]|nr:glycosyltransferase family 39 protein [Candidatus Thermoplasmatota archaeon]